MIREPEFAGSFYPGDKKDLEEMLAYLLKRASRKKVKNTKAILSPHAGYIYSGKIAASSYIQFTEEDIKTLIILGPSHHYAFYGASIWSKGTWLTPLGEIEIDEDVAGELLSSSQYFTDDPAFHKKEHSLEVQVPFIQHVLGNNVKIVPIVFGFPKQDILISLGKALTPLINKEGIGIVMSSDLYHGYSYEEALSYDALTRELITKMDAEEFYKAVMEERAMACGAVGITTFLIAAEGSGLKPHYIDYTNSAEVTGDYSGYVVGYLSMAFSKEG